MFGYVRTDKPQLKIVEFETYKAIYCSLCRQLGRDYGVFARLILSYDFTFLAMLRLSMADECCGYTVMRCPFNPLKRCNRLERDSEEIAYTAAGSVLMSYFKLRDDIADGGILTKLKAYILYPAFARYKKKAAKKYPQLYKHISDMIDRQAEIERENSSSLDACAEPSAKMLAGVFVRETDDDAKSRILEHTGYCIGKWVYLIDALDDLDDDLKTGSFNAVANKYHLKPADCADKDGSKSEARKNAAENVTALINVCNTQAAASFELLELKRYKSILGNIIYLGMPKTLSNLGKSKRELKNEAHGGNNERSV